MDQAREDTGPETDTNRAGFWLMTRAINGTRSPRTLPVGMPCLNVGRRNVCILYPNPTRLIVNVTQQPVDEAGPPGITSR